jgi:hypothetical protein
MRSLPFAACRVTRISLMAICLSQAGVRTADAQDRSNQPTPRPGWLPREVNIGGGLTAAQRATAIARLEAIERVFQQIPELAHPDGFEIRPQYYGGDRMRGPGDVEMPGNVVAYALRLAFFAPSKAIAGEGCVCIEAWVNFAAVTSAGLPIRDEQGRSIYIEPVRGDPLPHATQVYDRLSPTERSFVTVLLTSGGELPWTTVSREEYYNAIIFANEGKDGEKLAPYRKSLETTPYQQWLEGAPKRKSDREQMFAGLLAAKIQTAAEIAETRKELEATEREVTERLEASNDADRERNQQALSASFTYANDIRAELAAMTAAERSMPAWIDLARSDGPNATGFRVTDRDSPTTWRVLTPRLDFWRARKSPVEVRGISLQFSASGTGQVPAVHNALWKAYTNLDWAALNRMLDTPR